MARLRDRAAHVVVGPDPHTATCLHCGGTLDLALPMDIGLVVRSMKAFVNQHRACPPPAAEASA